MENEQKVIELRFCRICGEYISQKEECFKEKDGSCLCPDCKESLDMLKKEWGDD